MKKLGIAAGVLVLVVVIGVALVLSQLGRLIKHGVETYGPPITGTPVSLSSAHVSIFSGEGSLSGLDIGSPPSFTTRRAFELGHIGIAIDPKSVTGDVIHIRSLVVDAASVVAEFSAEGRSNLTEILQHAQAQARTTPKPPPGQRGGGTRTKMIIDDFRFTNAEVRALCVPLKLDRTLKIPPIVRKNLGGKNGATAAAIAEEVLKPVIEAAVQAAAAEYMKARGGDLGQKLLQRFNKPDRD